MHSNRLGCLTGTGILSVFVVVFAIVGVAFASGSQMFTAGPLNNVNKSGITYGGVTAHAQIPECKACHTAPWERETMADRCAKCHTDIAADMFNIAKLHGIITQKSPKLACRDCHPEHRGPTASLTELGDNAFPHQALGFSLNAHQLKVTREPFTCKDCHGEDVTTFASSACDNCHRQTDVAFTQAHVLAFGTDCLVCHDGVDRFGEGFNHSAFAFKLDGKHSDAACTGCHLGAHNIAALQSAPQDCFSCHSKDDAHQARFGQDCGSCHSSKGWTPAKFDHNLAAFKLEGEHIEVDCEKCHRNGVFKGTPADCFSCHQKDDEHGGQFGTDCGVCHSPTGWENATFDHSRSAFQLTGAHQSVACVQCHVNNVFKGTSSDCVSCHADPAYHAGMFGTNCAQCHTTSNWSAPYTGPHPGIAEEGGSGVNHGGATCRTCHTSTLREATCTACHEGNPGSEGEHEGGGN